MNGQLTLTGNLCLQRLAGVALGRPYVIGDQTGRPSTYTSTWSAQ
jgi:hypothetical protein